MTALRTALFVVVLSVFLRLLYRSHRPQFTWEDCKVVAQYPESCSAPREVWTQFWYDLSKRFTNNSKLAQSLEGAFEVLPGVKLTPNKFPYRVARGISHQLAWISSGASLTYGDQAITQAVKLHFSPYPTLVFENPPEKRSIPSYRHFHIFVRTSTQHGRSGYAFHR